MSLRVQELREAAGLTKRQLASMSGVTERTLFSLEHGTHQPNVATMQKIADALGVPVHSLLGGTS